MGSTRLGRDFDHLAGALARDYRVICPDMPGRGESDWFDHKMDYQPPNYVAACAALIARLEVERVDWLGTSMGGLVGMIMASTPNAPIARMVVNDIGPFVPKAAIERIATYIGHRSALRQPWPKPRRCIARTPRPSASSAMITGGI